MKYKLLSLIFLSSSFLLLANNFHNQLILPVININNPEWIYAYQPIAEKEAGAFQQLIIKWNTNLDKLWITLSRKIRDELNASPQQLAYYLNDQRFVDAYMNHYQQAFPEILDDIQNIDEIVLNFIILKANYLGLNKPLKILAKDNIVAATLSFGTDKDGHYLIVNDNLYNAENINRLYYFSCYRIYLQDFFYPSFVDFNSVYHFL